MMHFLIVALVMSWLGCWMFTGMVAATKNRHAVVWGILGFVYGPVALVAVGLMARVEGNEKVSVSPGEVVALIVGVIILLFGMGNAVSECMMDDMGL